VSGSRCICSRLPGRPEVQQRAVLRGKGLKAKPARPAHLFQCCFQVPPDCALQQNPAEQVLAAVLSHRERRAAASTGEGTKVFVKGFLACG